MSEDQAIELISKHIPPRQSLLLAKELLSLVYEAASAAPADDTISIQEAWEAAGGNPGIKATREDLLIALRDLDAAVDEMPPKSAEPAEGREPIPLTAIATLLNEVMTQAVANGADSRSMPDDYVAIAHFVSYPERYTLATTPTIPADCDVRKILLRVVPGDGDGLEIYAKNVAEVEALLVELGERLEDFESRATAPTMSEAAHGLRVTRAEIDLSSVTRCWPITLKSANAR